MGISTQRVKIDILQTEIMVKSSIYSHGSIQALLDRIDGLEFVALLGIENGDAVDDANEARTYCKVCKDRAKMTFVVEKASRRAYCTNLYCEASNMNAGGGNFVEMYALVNEEANLDAAIEQLAEKYDVKLEKIASKGDGQDLSEAAFQYVELGHTKPDEENPTEMIPTKFKFAGQECDGRGIYIQREHLPDFAQQYRQDVYHSHFRYNTSEARKIAQDYDQGKLVLMGDYYIVFNASSSAEIVHAINQAIDLVERLKESYDVPYEAVCVFYTSRNIEVHVDHTVFEASPTVSLNEIYRRMTCAVIGVDPHKPERSAAFSQIDLDAYAYDYLTNIPATLVSTGSREIYKIRMTYGAFKKMSYQRLHEFSLRRPDLPPREPWANVAVKARDFFNSVKTGLLRDSRTDDRDTIASLFYRASEETAGISTLKRLAPTLLRRLFDENRHVIPTFSNHLNHAFAGGLYPGQVYVLAGFPGSGTSTLALQIMNQAAADCDAHCLFIGLQRGVEEVFKRSLSFLGRISALEIDEKRQNPADLYEDKDFNRRIFNAYERYQQFADNITILEGAAAGSLANLRQLIVAKKDQIKESGSRASGLLVVVDSLQLLVALNRAIWAEQNLSKEGESIGLAAWDVDTLTSRLKAMARELDVTVLATFEHHAPHTGLASGIVERDPAYQTLLSTTQFADSVSVITRQGSSLLNLRDFFTTELTGTPQESMIGQTSTQLSKIEEDYRATTEFEALRSEFSVLDIIKNRNGTREKVLFVYHKPLSYFEPLDYRKAIR